MNLSKVLIIGILFFINSTSAETKKTVLTHKITTIPVIDGIIDEAVWQTVQPATDFFRFEPESGGHAPVRTEVRFLYDDISLYVAARMADPDPGSIPRQLGKRDDDGVVSDWLGIWLNPFNDGANEVGFLVTAAGVQVDQKFSPSGNDPNWNPVWESDISFDEEGWSVEMAIPFSQIRFPSKSLQTWGVNMARNRASVREIYTWTSLDKARDNFAQQAGLLLGIESIEPPLRLSLTPYASVAAESYPLEDGGLGTSQTYRGGMDLQYGINESFTLDMTLIPDFGQVQSDNVELNLSPFEIYYDEHRPFFTEGTQLLHKAGLFYSRRVGGQPIRYWQVADEEILKEGESIKANPDVTQLINATKVTGQTVGGIGLGLFNAITAPMKAVIEDSLGNEREYLTNPTSNYNLLVLNKNLRNGSEVSLTNSNVQRFAREDTSNDFRDANVFGYEARLYTKDSKWRLFSSGAYDYLTYPDSSSTGYSYYIEIAEDEGTLQYGLGQGMESEFYNPNDLGFLRQPNEVNQFAWLELRTLNPVWKVNSASMNLRASYSSLFEPHVYTGFHLNSNYDVTFRNYFSMGGGWSWSPKEGHDYYESRVDGRFFTTPKAFDTHIWLSSNYNRPLAASGWVGISSVTRRGSQWKGGGFDPRWRINNQLMLQYNFEINHQSNNHGFADYDEDENPIFGKRDRITTTNTIYSRFIVNRSLESELRMRHYRSSVKYKEFFDLLSDGNLTPSTYTGDHNTVYNALTVDAVVTWRFAPGSELNFTWKNAIFTESDNVDTRLYDDLRNLPAQDQSNSISVKLLYYVDYWSLKHRFE